MLTGNINQLNYFLIIFSHLAINIILAIMIRAETCPSVAQANMRFYSTLVLDCRQNQRNAS